MRSKKDNTNHFTIDYVFYINFRIESGCKHGLQYCVKLLPSL